VGLVVELVGAADEVDRFPRKALGLVEGASARSELRLRTAPEALSVVVVARRGIAAHANRGCRFVEAVQLVERLGP
jgi:hypothetical protein